MSFLKHFFPTSRTTKLEEKVKQIKNRLFKPEKESSGSGELSYESLFNAMHSSSCSYTIKTSVEEQVNELRRDINLILNHLKVEVQHERKDEFNLKALRQASKK